jgi:ribosomal protein L2
MKRVTAMMSTAGMALTLSLSGWAQAQTQTATLPTQTATVKGTVETIDHNRRVVNIKTSDGRFETIDVPSSATRFDEVKVGDKVSITYNNNVSARLKPAGEADVDTGNTASTAGQQARPGGTTALQRTMTATISAIDRNASSISFAGPNGWKYTRHVVEPAVFDTVKVGDKVDITWNTDVTVAMQ